MAHDVFISYSSKDKPAADATCARLESRDIRCWMAPRDIQPGSDWSTSIIDAINGASVMVLVFSANANASPQIKREVERAVNKGIPVIPLRIENVAPEKSLEYFISTPHWLDAYSPPLDRHLNYLADVIRHILDGKTVPVPPAPLPPPWWRGPVGWAAAGGGVLALLVLIWFAFLRPPPSFAGTWNATSLDIAQFNNEDAALNALVPIPLLQNTLKGANASGVLTIDPSGQFTLAVSGTDQGQLISQPATIGAPGANTLTFKSDATHQSYSANLMLFKIETGSAGIAYNPQTDPPPNGVGAWEIIFMPEGQTAGGSLGVMVGQPNYKGTPDGGGMRLIDLIAGSWAPMPMTPSGSSNGENTKGVTALLTIDASGHYSLTYSLHESGLWKGENGNWTRQGSVTVGYSSSVPDTGTYSFSGRNQLNLFDQNGSSVWQRSS